MPMGPIELTDQVGLDIALDVSSSLRERLDVPFPDSPGWLKTMVGEGKLGRKTGAGLYDYDSDGKPKKKRADSLPDSAKDDPDILDRLILPMLNAVVACLREGVVDSEDVADGAMIFGTGFAPFRGGPIHYARQRGVDDIVAKLNGAAGKARRPLQARRGLGSSEGLMTRPLRGCRPRGRGRRRGGRAQRRPRAAAGARQGEPSRQRALPAGGARSLARPDDPHGAVPRSAVRRRRPRRPLRRPAGGAALRRRDPARLRRGAPARRAAGERAGVRVLHAGRDAPVEPPGADGLHHRQLHPRGRASSSTRGVNVIGQMVAPSPDRTRWSLSCNTDMTLDLMPDVEAARREGRPMLLVGEANANLPFFGGTAALPTGGLRPHSRRRTRSSDARLFSVPRQPVTPAEHAIGLSRPRW